MDRKKSKSKSKSKTKTPRGKRVRGGEGTEEENVETLFNNLLWLNHFNSLLDPLILPTDLHMDDSTNNDKLPQKAKIKQFLNGPFLKPKEENESLSLANVFNIDTLPKTLVGSMAPLDKIPYNIIVYRFGVGYIMISRNGVPFKVVNSNITFDPNITFEWAFGLQLIFGDLIIENVNGSPKSYFFGDPRYFEDLYKTLTTPLISSNPTNAGIRNCEYDMVSVERDINDIFINSPRRLSGRFPATFSVQCDYGVIKNVCVRSKNTGNIRVVDVINKVSKDKLLEVLQGRRKMMELETAKEFIKEDTISSTPAVVIRNNEYIIMSHKGIPLTLTLSSTAPTKCMLSFTDVSNEFEIEGEPNTFGRKGGLLLQQNDVILDTAVNDQPFIYKLDNIKFGGKLKKSAKKVSSKSKSKPKPKPKPKKDIGKI